MTKDKVFVITGAAGSGKTTVRDYLVEKYRMAKVITHTTRAPRDQEQSGVDYYFESLASFEANHYLESVKYAGNYYGSSFEGLENAFNKSSMATIVLDTDGAITYKAKLKDQAVIIFLTVADQDTLVERMIQRGDKAAIVQKRILSSEYVRDLNLPNELKNQAFVVSNNDWIQTKRQIDEIVSENKTD